MSLKTSILLDAVGSTQDSAATRFVTVSNDDLIVQVIASGAPNGSMAIKGSLDGTNWYTLATKTAGEIFKVTGVPYLKASLTWTAGTWSVIVATS